MGVESDHVAYLLLCFLVLAVAGWVLGKWPARLPATLVAAALIVAGLAIPLSQPKAVAVSGPNQASVATSQPNLLWQPYTPAALETARAAGRPVFIDFTAAWCLSCQVNEKVVLRSAEVERQLAQHGFTLLRADWTQYDSGITAELASLNRSGVPTYVIYPAKGQADVLPELLTKDAVLEGIDRDSK
jgi:thiol:disulfide interchange protein DsbD